MSLQPGELLHERYRIVRMIKSGGMATVFEAQDVKLANSPCAVKEIHDAALASRDLQYIQQKFYEEMKAMVALDHPAIPKVRDYVQQGTTLYLVMELVKGRSLEEEMAERESPPVEQIVQDMIMLLDTLDYLHHQNPPIIHRDVKPSNILRDMRNGTVKLVDFGLAKAVESQSTHSVVGSHGYSSPEQLMGQPEPRSDVYSVGVTLAHLLTGEPPLMKVFEARRPELPGIRSGLADIIARATEPELKDRYSSAHEMKLALQRWLAQGPVLVEQPQEKPAPMPGFARRKAAPAGNQLGVLIATFMIIFAVFLFLGMWAGRRSSENSVGPTAVTTP